MGMDEGASVNARSETGGMAPHVVPRATLPWITDLSVRVPPQALQPACIRFNYCTVTSLGAKRLRQGKGTRMRVWCVRVIEDMLRTGTSTPCMIQWLSMCPEISRFRNWDCFD